MSVAIMNSLKSMLPLPSLSNMRKIWSTKTCALPAGKIMLYMSKILVLLSVPSGQSTRKPLYHSLISASSYRVFFFKNSTSSEESAVEAWPLPPERLERWRLRLRLRRRLILAEAGGKAAISSAGPAAEASASASAASAIAENPREGEARANPGHKLKREKLATKKQDCLLFFPKRDFFPGGLREEGGDGWSSSSSFGREWLAHTCLSGANAREEDWKGERDSLMSSFMECERTDLCGENRTASCEKGIPSHSHLLLKKLVLSPFSTSSKGSFEVLPPAPISEAIHADVVAVLVPLLRLLLLSPPSSWVGGRRRMASGADEKGPSTTTTAFSA